MVRNQKRVFRKFSYRECDRFAAFLRGQSLKGWHFKEWKMGLVFEKGEKRDVVYDVQVFPEGSENDYTPAADEEYSDYCEVAGWELVDGQRRFCIFRRHGEDVVPIVTEEEKLKNVCTAERKQWLRESLSYALLAGLFLCQYILWPVSAMHFYNNMIMFIVCIAVIRLLWRVADGIWLSWWAHGQKKKLADGEAVTYDRAGMQKNILVSLREDLCLGILFLLAIQAGYGGIAIGFLLFMIVLVGAEALISYLRPDKGETWMTQLGIGLVTLLMAVVVVAIVLGDGGFETGEWSAGGEVPLLQEDYKDVPGKMEIEDYFHQKGVFGEMFSFWIRYVPEDELSNEERSGMSGEEAERWEARQWEETDFLRYEVYQSLYPWIVERTWDVTVKDRELEECTAQWDAVYAGYWEGGGCYYVKYEDAVWMVDTGERLSDGQVEIVREKLEKAGQDAPHESPTRK